MTSIGGAEMVDWNLAVATATRLVRPGPEVSRDEAREVVAELRRHAKASELHVRAFTRMGTEDTHDTPVLVVDRPGWVRANVAGFREVLKPLLDKMQERRGSTPGGAVLGAVGGKVTGVELGMLLSFLSSRVLGQYETFAPATRELPAGSSSDSPSGGGRLLLVAPNIVHVERELDVQPHDFRLWVCLHEETHRTQFTAVPWLRAHLEGEIQSFLGETEVDPMTVLERIREAAQSLAGATGQTVNAVLLGSALDGLAQEIASFDLGKVIAAENDKLTSYTPDGYTDGMEQVIRAEDPKYVVMPHTYLVRDFAPKLSARCRIRCPFSVRPTTILPNTARCSPGFPVFSKQWTPPNNCPQRTCNPMARGWPWALA